MPGAHCHDTCQTLVSLLSHRQINHHILHSSSDAFEFDSMLVVSPLVEKQISGFAKIWEGSCNIGWSVGCSDGKTRGCVTGNIICLDLSPTKTLAYFWKSAQADWVCEEKDGNTKELQYTPQGPFHHLQSLKHIIVSNSVAYSLHIFKSCQVQ